MALDKKKANKTRADIMLEEEASRLSSNLVEMTLQDLGTNKQPEKTTENKAIQPVAKTQPVLAPASSSPAWAPNVVPQNGKRAKGRPTNASNGLANKKQCTIFISPLIHDKIRDIAKVKDVTFSKMAEIILKEYVETHI